MQDKLKESISKSVHFGYVLCRERELLFFSSGHKSQGEQISQEGTNPREMGMFSKAFILVVPYNSVQSVLYKLGTFFKEGHAVYDLLGMFFRHENRGGYCGGRTSRTVSWAHKSRWARKTRIWYSHLLL